MIYYANDADGVNKAVSGLESVIDAKVAADTTLTKGSADSIPDWVIPNKAQLVSGEWVEYRVVTTADVRAALHAFLDQADEWEIGLVVYGGTIEAFGKGALSAGRQGAIDYAQDTTYSLAIRVKGLLNLALGASDITSPQVLAAQIDQFSQIPNQDPLTKIVWVDRATGERITLQAAVAAKWGALSTTFKAYTRPAVTA